MNSKRTYNLPNLQDRVIQGYGSRGTVGSYLNESLPNIKGYTNYGLFSNQAYPTGCFTQTNQSTSGSSTTGIDGWRAQIFDASRSSSTYQDNAPVQQNALCLMVIVKY